MRIEIAEIANQGRFTVWHEGAVLIASTQTPFFSAARVLLDRGADPDEMLEKTRRGSDQVDMRARIGKAAGLTVAADSKTGRPYIVRYRGDADADQGAATYTERVRPLAKSRRGIPAHQNERGVLQDAAAGDSPVVTERGAHAA